ncbi:MAG: hypothetical protein CL878_15395 [Dehalococcoidia bacterium]|nr:hypothetical protein [Dehalococcoidia bacterium]
MMTNRERLLAILNGQAPDRIPWIPRLLIWYNARMQTNTMPDRFRGMSLREIERAVGVGAPARNGHIFETELRDVEVREHHTGRDTITEYTTPVGTVSFRTNLPPELERVGIQATEVEFLLKEPEDYDVLAFMTEHTVYHPTYEAYLDYEAEIGDDGLPMVQCGDCPFHHFLRKFAGYNQAYFELADRPQQVERLLALMTDHDETHLWPVVAESPAQLILHGAHFSSQMTPPSLFRQHIIPYYQRFSEQLHARGKTLALHADNDTGALLPLIREAGYDMVECFITAPMVDLTLAEARAAWGNDMIIWGGVPSVLLDESISDEEFEREMAGIFDAIAPGKAFILGVADNAMPEAKIERVERISELVEARGNYPVQPLPESVSVA